MEFARCRKKMYGNKTKDEREGNGKYKFTKGYTVGEQNKLKMSNVKPKAITINKQKYS